jgi:c-di-GMP-binding flagellar brake protein YcgR
MLKKLIKKTGLKANIKRKFPRGVYGVKLCATLLINYKKGDKTFKYGDCFSIRTYDISAGGMCISHPDRLLADKYIMINSKNNLKKVECINCSMVGIINDGFITKPIIAKVMWAKENRCGIEYVDISDGDRRKLDKLAKSSFEAKIL